VNFSRYSLRDSAACQADQREQTGDHPRDGGLVVGDGLREEQRKLAKEQKENILRCNYLVNKHLHEPRQGLRIVVTGERSEPVGEQDFNLPPREGRRIMRTDTLLCPLRGIGSGQETESTGYASLHPWLQYAAP